MYVGTEIVMEGQGVIYLRNWTISGIACGELECITVAFKVSSLFCFDHFSLSSSPLLSSSPVLPRTSVSLCHFPNFKVSQFICCHCEVKFNCLSLEVPLMWTVIQMISVTQLIHQVEFLFDYHVYTLQLTYFNWMTKTAVVSLYVLQRNNPDK